MVMEADGHTFFGTSDAEEALRAIDQCASDPCILFTDNFLVSPAALEALPRLKATPSLRRRARIIGLSASSGQAIAEGLVDVVVPLPFTPIMLLDAITPQKDPPTLP